MAFYIKVTKQVHQAMNVNGRRNNTADGNILLWQSDMVAIPGFTLDDKVKYVGGAKLSPQQAKAETDGVDNPAYVYTPKAYGGEDPEEKKATADETPSEAVPTEDDINTDNINEDVPSAEEGTTEGKNNKEEA